MFGNQVDEKFANTISQSAVVSRGGSFWPIIIILNLAIVLFLIWAANSEIEEVASGSGKVIPSSQVQKIQSLEGGIVSSISIKEGDIVEPNQVLMQIDDTGFSSRLGELTRKEYSLQAERIRLIAEAEEKTELVFSEELTSKAAISVSAEMQVFNSRRIQLLGELEVLENRLSQRQAELQELAARGAKLSATLAPLSKEAKLTKRLFKRGVVPEVEYLRLSSRLAEISGDRNVVKASVPKVEASIAEAKKQLSTTKNTYVLAARERLAKLEAELAVVRETMTAATDRVSRTQLRAPVRGVVNKINTTTLGAVVQPGQEIVEIVPLDDGLLIEVSIRPQDVAFVKPGESASVKLTAYDYLIYGALKGTVIRIGADTIADAAGEQFYRVVVRTEKNYLGDDATRLNIIPGMVASVDLQTGTNTVLSYLLKPILRAKGTALRER